MSVFGLRWCGVFGHNFLSSEHAYQWHFLTYIDMPDLPQEVLNSSIVAEAKAIASKVPNYIHRDWHKIQICMREILHAKADNCEQFRESLLKSTANV